MLAKIKDNSLKTPLKTAYDSGTETKINRTLQPIEKRMI